MEEDKNLQGKKIFAKINTYLGPVQSLRLPSHSLAAKLVKAPNLTVDQENNDDDDEIDPPTDQQDQVQDQDQDQDKDQDQAQDQEQDKQQLQDAKAQQNNEEQSFITNNILVFSRLCSSPQNLTQNQQDFSSPKQTQLNNSALNLNHVEVDILSQNGLQATDAKPRRQIIDTEISGDNEMPSEERQFQQSVGFTGARRNKPAVSVFSEAQNQNSVMIQAPNYNNLIEYINQNHCRVPLKQGDPIDKVRKYDVWLTEMGIMSCRKQDRKSQIDHDGVGVVLYFMLYKYLAIIFILMFMFTITNLFFFANGNGIEANQSFSWQDGLTRLTLGNLGENGQACSMEILPQKLQCSQGAIRSDQLKLYNARDENGCNQSVKQATEKSIKSFSCTDNMDDVSCTFNGDVKDLEGISHPMFIVPCQIQQISIFKTDTTVSKDIISIVIVTLDIVCVVAFILSLIIIRKWEYLIEFEVEKERITVRDYSVQVKNIPEGINQHQFRNQLWNFLESRVRMFTGQDARVIDIQFAYNDNEILFKRMKINRLAKKEAISKLRLDTLHAMRKNTNVQQQKLKKKLNDLKEKRRKQQAKLENVNKSTSVAKAFVTFQSESAQRRAIKTFNKTKCRRCCMIGCCQRQKIADYYYRNEWLQVKQAPQPSVILWENLSVSKLSRCCRKIFSIFIATILIFVSFAFILVAKYYQNRSLGTELNCQSSDTITQQQALADFSLGDNSLGIYKCFCKKQFFDTTDTSPPQEMCQQWLNSWLEAQGWSIGSIIAIAFVNVVLVLILRLLSRFERKHSQNQQLTSASIKIFIAIFFNSALVLLLANANINIQILRQQEWFPIFAGQYQDFQVGWYQKVGSSIILTMLINLITPHMTGIAECFLTSFKRCCDRSCRCHRKHTKKLIQQDYQKLYLGPEFLLEYRYSQILNILYISFMYSSGMPVLYLLGAIWYTITFFIDKCLYLRLYRKLPHFDRMVHSRIRSFFDYAIFLHMGIGFWMYSNTQIFFTNETSFQSITQNVSFLDPKRFQTTHSIFMILAFGGVIVFYIFRKFCLQQCLKCCWKNKNDLNQREKQNKAYYQILDINHLLERQKRLKDVYIQVQKQANQHAKETRKITDRQRKQIAAMVNNKIKEVDQNFGNIINSKGKLDIKYVKKFIDINKQKLPKMKINGLSSYVMTQNPTYADLVNSNRHSSRKETVKKDDKVDSLQIIDEGQQLPK